MLISYFGKTKAREFEFQNVNYPSLSLPVSLENHREFKERMEKIKKVRGWTIGMFNPISEKLQGQEVNDQGVWG